MQNVEAIVAERFYAEFGRAFHKALDAEVRVQEMAKEIARLEKENAEMKPRPPAVDTSGTDEMGGN